MRYKLGHLVLLRAILGIGVRGNNLVEQAQSLLCGVGRLWHRASLPHTDPSRSAASPGAPNPPVFAGRTAAFLCLRNGTQRPQCEDGRQVPAHIAAHEEYTVSLEVAQSYVTRIDHVGIAVRDLDQAKEFYAKSLGLKSIHEETNEEQGVREAMLAVGDSGSCIQLLAPLTDDSPIGKFLARSGEGIQQMAYTVSDMDALCDHLRSVGVRVLYDTPKRGTANSRVNFVHPKDAGGVLIELVEPATDAHH